MQLRRSSLRAALIGTAIVFFLFAQGSLATAIPASYSPHSTVGSSILFERQPFTSVTYASTNATHSSSCATLTDTIARMPILWKTTGVLKSELTVGVAPNPCSGATSSGSVVRSFATFYDTNFFRINTSGFHEITVKWRISFTATFNTSLGSNASTASFAKVALTVIVSSNMTCLGAGSTPPSASRLFVGENTTYRPTSSGLSVTNVSDVHVPTYGHVYVPAGVWCGVNTEVHDVFLVATSGSTSSASIFFDQRSPTRHDKLVSILVV